MESLSKAKLKLFAALKAKKNRLQHKLFVVEGKKMCAEVLLTDWPVRAIVIEKSRLAENETLLSSVPEAKYFLATKLDFQRISTLETPEGILLILEFPADDFFDAQHIESLPSGKGILLDRIQDPSNLGALMRVADWFGIRNIYCSPGTVDKLNPKSLRASMGAVFRVSLISVANWDEMLTAEAARILAADMGGLPVGDAVFGKNDYLLLGNEANGISEHIRTLSQLRKVSIPGGGDAESLNVAVAGGILVHYLVS